MKTLTGLSFFVVLFMLLQNPLASQVLGKDITYNKTYYSPLSLGLEVQFLSPNVLFGTDYGGDFALLDIGVMARYSIPAIPVLQPLLRIGILTIRASNNLVNTKFDNVRFYLAGGLTYLHKFSKNLEIGAELDLGFGYSVFNKIDPIGNDVFGAWNFQTSIGARVVFNPSYNLSVNAHPFIGYNTSFSPLERFNGFSVGLGISMDYRVGTDPDDPRAEIRSLEFEKPKVENVFAAMQSYYINNKFGEVTITNTEKFPLTDLEVKFFQPGYMSIASSVAQFDVLEPGEKKTVPITASFNQNIFQREGVTPLTGEIVVDYALRNRNATQKIPVVYDLYDKNSIVWDDDRRVAAFMTAGDSALGNFLSHLRASTKDVEILGYSESVQTAIRVFYGLTSIGCVYQRDPTLAFEDVQGNAFMVDSVNLPRETLIKLTGDCDDLTVLFNALLEASGIETAFITAPGHIYSAFNTGIPAKDYRLVHPEKTMTLAIDGELWVPVEITFIGEEDFQTAWRSGADEFNRYVDDGNKLNLYFTREAQKIFRPVGFQERDIGLQYGEQTQTMLAFQNEVKTITDQVMNYYQERAEQDGEKNAYNTYGIVCAQFEDFDRAEQAFNNALALDRNYISPKVNLAHVYFLKEEYINALRLFHDAERTFLINNEEDSSGYARVILNIAKTYYELESYDQATEYGEKLAQINPTIAERYSYLFKLGSE